VETLRSPIICNFPASMLMQSLTTVTIEVQTTYAIGDRHTGMKGDGHRIGMVIISIPMQAEVIVMSWWLTCK